MNRSCWMSTGFRHTAQLMKVAHEHQYWQNFYVQHLPNLFDENIIIFSQNHLTFMKRQM